MQAPSFPSGPRQDFEPHQKAPELDFADDMLPLALQGDLTVLLPHVDVTC